MERQEKFRAVVRQFLQESADTNPYASAEKVRAMDRVIRNTIADDLAHAAGMWRRAYQTQAAALGHPTRERPVPTAEDLARVKALKMIADRLSALASAVMELETPASDRVYHRLRDNDLLLDQLVDEDYAAIPVSQHIREVRPDQADANPMIEAVIAQVEAWMERRRQWLARAGWTSL